MAHGVGHSLSPDAPTPPDIRRRVALATETSVAGGSRISLYGTGGGAPGKRLARSAGRRWDARLCRPRLRRGHILPCGGGAAHWTHVARNRAAARLGGGGEALARHVCALQLQLYRGLIMITESRRLTPAPTSSFGEPLIQDDDNAARRSVAGMRVSDARHARSGKLGYRSAPASALEDFCGWRSDPGLQRAAGGGREWWWTISCLRRRQHLRLPQHISSGVRVRTDGPAPNHPHVLGREP